jgi:RNA polymerase sigma-B factor
MSTTTIGPLDLAMIDDLANAYVRSGCSVPARDRLIAAALPFAVRLSRRYRSRGEPLDDLEQVASVGLLKAINRYDPARGGFSGFAAITIIGELRRHFRDRTWGVHVSRRLQELSLEVARASADLTAELRRSPTVAELATRLEVGEPDVRAAIGAAAAYSPTSLNGPAGADGQAELGDLVGHPDRALEAIDDHVSVNALLRRLPDRERRILAMRFHGNLTQAEIASEFGVSQMHVSRLLSRALTWLREAMLSDAPLYWRAGPAPSDVHELNLRVRRQAGLVRLDVVGEVDRDTVGPLRDALLAAVAPPVKVIEVRLDGVPFMDAAGVAVLRAGYEAARSNGTRMRIRGAKPYVRQSLGIAGLRPLLSAEAGIVA